MATEHEFDLFLLLLALALEEAPAAAKDTFWDWRCEKRTDVNFFLIAPPCPVKKKSEYDSYEEKNKPIPVNQPSNETKPTKQQNKTN